MKRVAFFISGTGGNALNLLTVTVELKGEASVVRPYKFSAPRPCDSRGMHGRESWRSQPELYSR